MDFQKPKKEELATLLVEKHRNFSRDYRREYDVLDRIAVLKEKKEQLIYWIDDSKGNAELHQKYINAKENADKEEAKLHDELKNLYSSKSRKFGPPEADSKARYKWLKTQINSHEDAEKFWKNKIIEMQREGEIKAKADEAAKASAAKEARKAKIAKKQAEKKQKTPKTKTRKKAKAEKAAAESKPKQA